MNRRNFITTTGILATIPTITIADDEPFRADGPEVIMEEIIRSMPIGGEITIKRTGKTTYFITGDVNNPFRK